MNWLLVLISFSGHVQMMHVSREQCLSAVSYYRETHAPRLIADCFPPDARYKVEGASGGTTESHHSGFARKDLPQQPPQQ